LKELWRVLNFGNFEGEKKATLPCTLHYRILESCRNCNYFVVCAHIDYVRERKAQRPVTAEFRKGPLATRQDEAEAGNSPNLGATSCGYDRDITTGGNREH
jgi:hypothetical protein